MTRIAPANKMSSTQQDDIAITRSSRDISLAKSCSTIWKGIGSTLAKSVRATMMGVSVNTTMSFDVTTYNHEDALFDRLK